MDQLSDDVPVDDGELLKKCQRGDEDALAEIIQRYRKRLYQLTLRVCGDGSLAEEATVEAFYKIWLKAYQWRAETGPESWIYRIAVRTVLDLRRGRGRWRDRLKRAGIANNQEPSQDVLESIVAAEQHERISDELERAIGQLKPEDRVLVHLFYYENRGLKEIATVLGATPDALKMRLARARKRLRKTLEECDDE